MDYSPQNVTFPVKMDFNPFSSGIPVFYGMYSISIASLRHYKRRDRGRSVKARKRKRAEGRAPLDPRVFRRACDYARSSSVSAWAVAKAAAPTAAAAATAAAPAFKAPSSPVGAKGLGSLASFAGGCGSGARARASAWGRGQCLDRDQVQPASRCAPDLWHSHIAAR